MAAFYVALTLLCLLCGNSHRLKHSDVAGVRATDEGTSASVGGKPFFKVPAEFRCEERSYLHSNRAQCDEKLYDIIKPLYARGGGTKSTLYTGLEEEGFAAAWKCYAQDPCFMSPPGPSSVGLSVKQEADGSSVVVVEMTSEQRQDRVDFPITTKAGETGETVKMWQDLAQSFRWYSFEEWRSALFKAVSGAMTAAASAGQSIDLAIDMSSHGADVTSESDPLFNQTMRKYPKLMYKSELWTLIHVLNALNLGQNPQVKGVIWLGTRAHRIDEPKLKGESALLMPFDATYSGHQMAKTLEWFMGLIKRSVEGDEPKLYGAVAIARAGARDRIASGVDSEVLVGHEAQEKNFAPQFKLPDSASFNGNINLLLRCALCCAGEDVHRTPYKVFTRRRLESCDGLQAPPSLGSKCSCAGTGQ